MVTLQVAHCSTFSFTEYHINGVFASKVCGCRFIFIEILPGIACCGVNSGNRHVVMEDVKAAWLNFYRVPCVVYDVRRRAIAFLRQAYEPSCITFNYVLQ